MSETLMNSHAFQSIIDSIIDQKILLKSLDVSFNNDLYNDSAMILYNAIRRIPIISSRLEILKIGGSNISYEGIDKISELFSNGYFPSLRTISVAFNTIDPVMSAKFIASLKGSPLLEEIDMTSCNIGFNGIIALSELISSSKESKIKTLSLSNNNILSDGIKVLAKAFEPSLESKIIKSFSITELDLSKNYIFGEGAKALGNIVQQLPNLLILNLSDNNIDTEGSEYLISFLPKSLTYLDLSLNRMNSPNSFNFSHLTKLEYLNLSQCTISTESATVLGNSLISCSKNLEILNLSYNDIDDEGITLISNGLNKGRGSQLRYLDLSWNRIKEEGAINFSALILGKKGVAPRLENLDLGNNKIGDFGIGCLLMALEYRYGSSDNKIGIDNIRRRSHLICLGLDNNDIGDVGVSQIGKILSNRQSFSRFKYISLRNNLFSIDGLYRMKDHFCKKGATKPPLKLIVRGELISRTDITKLASSYLAFDTSVLF
jgi:Ran GTPase-activating protein (RanGAP) involved in mRNA processing and transport